jgi:hypothetical protein
MTTYADAYRITPPARLVVAPCCRRRRAADMIVEVPLARRAELGRWLCDGCRARLHRAGAGATLAGSR